MNLRGAVLSLSLLAAAPALAQTKPPNATPLPTPSPNAPAVPQGDTDLAYGAYQRGYFLTAFNEASKRAQQNDAAAMTLLGELYANGLGVGRDDIKAAQWYKMAAAQGNRDALFALAMFAFAGRAGPSDPTEGTRLLTEAAKLGNPIANYNLGLLYLQGQQFAQDFARAAELFRVAANAGNPEAQYALATMYKEGRGVAKDPKQAALLMARASIAGNVDAMVEFAIMQFNGDGTEKSEPAAADTFLRAARRGSPIAQNRLARILMAGRGLPADPVEAVKWHMIAKTAGAGDPELDAFMARQTPQIREAADKAAKKWLSTMAAVAP